MTTETRIVNATTGGEKGQKDVQMSLIPVEELQEVARLYRFGAQKYSEDNWRKGYDWRLSYDALQRHAMAFWNGESNDDETKCHHLSSVVFHALALMYFEQHHPELDSRPSTVLARRQAAAGVEELDPTL